MANDVTDLNALYDAFRASMRGSPWKEETQLFERNFLSEIVKLKKELENRTYKTSPTSEFAIRERGKIRCIHGSRMRDRVVRHSFCDNVLSPKLEKYLISNNCASRKGKGVAKAREIFERDLHNYWLKYRTNDGYIGLMDFSKFYDNIRHGEIRKAIAPRLDGFERWLLDEILRSFRIDVSHMSGTEHKCCMDKKFNSVEYYQNIPPSQRTGKRYMEKSVDIGDQTSQNIGTYLPAKIDNLAKIVHGVKWYGRYMDDVYVVGKTSEEVGAVMTDISKTAKEMGFYINDKKTRITKLSKSFKYLQIRYFLTDSGRVVKRINPKAITRERRKLKAYKRLMNRGEMPYERIEQSYKSWMGANVRNMSKKQTENMKELFEELFERSPRWKK